MMFAPMRRLFRASEESYPAHRLYVRITEQSRQPVFYQTYQVADTLDGRFDMLVLHLCLVQQRLNNIHSKEAIELSRSLGEVFVADMDRSLREMGVGDTGISHRIKKMGEALLGRYHAYADACEGKDGKALEDALFKNVYRQEEGREECAKKLASYASACVDKLKALSDEALLVPDNYEFADPAA